LTADDHPGKAYPIIRYNIAIYTVPLPSSSSIICYGTVTLTAWISTRNRDESYR